MNPTFTDRIESRSSRNPFCTRYIRPGAIAFRFPAGDSLEALIDRLRRSDWRGAIIGPHGSGKTTLLETLLPVLERREGRRIVRFTLRDGARRLPKGWRTRMATGGNALVVIDGYEQLRWWSRLSLPSTCKRFRAGLLVTAHRSVSLATLYQTHPTLECAQEIVAELLSAYGGLRASVSPGDVAACFALHGGNVREMLMSLYDRFAECVHRSFTSADG